MQALTNALDAARLHHAYLFTGTRGIGKTTVSRILAKSLNCTGPDGRAASPPTPCGVCSACTEIDADRYIDYIELDAACNRGIDEIRDLIERAAYKPGVGRFKVFMIDEAHQLTKDAFNALLKTLEEPPEYLKFVLATTDPEKMLPTVLQPLPAVQPAADGARHRARASAAGARRRRRRPDDGALRLLARAARGSMRDALSLTDQAIAYGGGALERGRRARDARQRRPQPCRALVRRAGARATARAVLAAVDALREHGPVGRRHARGNGAAAAADGGRAGRARARSTAADPDTRRRPRAGRRCARRRDAAALQHGAARPRRAAAWCRDEYAALTMVLLRLLAFPRGRAATPCRAPASRVRLPASAARCAAACRAPQRAAVAPRRTRRRWRSPRSLPDRDAAQRPRHACRRRAAVVAAAIAAVRRRAAQPGRRRAGASARRPTRSMRPPPRWLPAPARRSADAGLLPTRAGRPLGRDRGHARQRQPVAALVRELAMQARTGRAATSGADAAVAAARRARDRCARRRLRDKLRAALADGAGHRRVAARARGRRARRHARRGATPPSAQRRQREAEADHPRRPAGAGTAARSSDRPHRARLDQTRRLQPRNTP